MMLVDSSVWIDFLAARMTLQTSYLLDRLGKDQIWTADLVLAEVLQGTRSERAFRIASEQLLALDVLTVSGPQVAVQAARNYRFLRARGITIRKTIDTLIATYCILEDVPLLYADRDFDPFVQHLGLRPALDLPGGH